MFAVGQRKQRVMERYIITGSSTNVLLRQYGFSYLAMLFLIAVLGVTLTTTYERSDTIAKRQKEKQLYFIGNQYKQALTSYYNASPGGFKELPKNIEGLLKDSRFVTTKRHLRKQYLDPMTGGDMQLILDEDERIAGVYSASNESILQTALFEESDPTNPATEKEPPRIYSEVKFEYESSDELESLEAGDDLGEDALSNGGIDAF